VKPLFYAELFFLFFASGSSRAQLSMISGLGFSDIKENAISFDRKSRLSWQHGVMLTLTPVKKWSQFSVSHQLSLLRNGYAIEIGNQTFKYKFRYGSIAITADYAPVDFLRLRAGCYGSILLLSNIKRGYLTYDITDGGVLASISLFENRRVSFLIEGRQGLKPILDYQMFDANGSFVQDGHDIYHLSLNFMVKANLVNRKILFQE
jgi:hypothetical protein